MCFEFRLAVEHCGHGLGHRHESECATHAIRLRVAGILIVAGSAADGLSLLERLEMKLEEHPGG